MWPAAIRSDGVLIWTRLSGLGGAAAELEWIVAEDEELSRPNASGRAEATPEADSARQIP